MQLESKISDWVSRVKGNTPELSRLVAILLDNAISHGAPNTTVKLSLARVGAYAQGLW